MIEVLKSIGFKAVVSILPVMAIVVATNIVVDPANVIHDISPDIASLLLQKKNVSLLKENFTFSAQRTEYLSRTGQADIVILGSSRSLQIRKWMLPPETFYNASVPNAQIELQQELYALLRERKHIPKTVIFCCDHWLFDLQKVENIQTSQHVNAGFSPFRLSSLANRIIPTKYMEMMSFSYLQSSISFLRTNRSLQQFYATNDTNDANMLILADGGLQYSGEIRHRTIEDVRRIVEMDLRRNNAKKKGDPTKFEERKTDPKRVTAFEDLLKTMRNDGVRVVLFLSPYHPLFYKNLPSLDATETVLRGIAERQNISVFGAYNPEKLGLTEADFFDYWHPTPEGLTKVFARDSVQSLFVKPVAQ